MLQSFYRGPQPTLPPQHEEECLLCSDATCSGERAGGGSTGAAYTQLLQQAHRQISRTSAACACWSWPYDGLSPPPELATRLLGEARTLSPNPYPKLRTSSDPTNASSEGGAATNPLLVGVTRAQGRQRRNSLPLSTSAATSGSLSSNANKPQAPSSSSKAPRKPPLPPHPGMCIPHPSIMNLSHDEDPQPDSLGESSGYESFNIRTSRDSSPSSPPSGAPSSPPSGSPLRTSRSRGGRKTPPSRHQLITVETEQLDEQFLDELLAWDVVGDPACEDSTGDTMQQHAALTDDRQTTKKMLEDAIYDIDSAFSAYAAPSPQHTFSQDSDSDDVNWDEPGWSCPPSPANTPPPPPHGRPTIGPFLEAVVERVEGVLSCSIPVTRLLFSLVLRLASYPAPLLASLLLHPSLLCQPAVRSLYQVLSSLKQRIDALLSDDDAHLLAEARVWLAQQQHAVHMIPQHHNYTTPPHHHTNTTTIITPQTNLHEPFKQGQFGIHLQEP